MMETGDSGVEGEWDAGAITPVDVGKDAWDRDDWLNTGSN